MKIFRIASALLFGAATLFAASSSALAADYYINSVSGSDGNSGTSASAPWASLSKVNAKTYAAGDRILFACGGTWTGQLAPHGSGASGNPITITSYGSGNKPIIQSNGTAHNTVYFYNQQYWTIDGLDISNNAGSAATNLGDYRGIGVQAQDIGQVNGFTIQNCSIHDVTGEVKWVGGSTSGNKTGITFNTGWDASKKTGGIVFWVTTANNTKTWFNNVLVQGNQIVNCSMVGVTLKQWVGTANWGKRASASDTNWTPHTNVTIKNNYFTQNGTAYGCDGIYPTNVRGATIENNEVAGCGTCAIEMVFCDSIVVADNETYNVTRKAGGGDANGIDPDHGTTGITIEYNYSHDNQLNGILMFQIDGYGSSVVRYNILQNNKTNQIWCQSGSGSHSDIYNNVFYTNIANQQMVSGDNGGTFSLENNIFYAAASGATFSTAGISYNYNNYHGTSMVVPPDAHALVADPRMVNPGSGGSGGINGTANNTLTGYQLQSSSPCLSAGTSIANNGGIDFWGHPLPTGALDIGADQYSQSGSGSAKAISINFVGGGSAIGAAEVAGVIAKANWNNASSASGSGLGLQDETGASSGGTVTWASDHTSTASISDTAGNNRMVRGFLNTSNTSTTTVTVSGLPSDPNGYDVYVYAQTSQPSGVTRTAAYQISGTGITSTTINATASTANFTGTFTQANNSTGNYVKYTIGNVTGFTVKASAVSASDSILRAPLNGIQIIPK